MRKRRKEKYIIHKTHDDTAVLIDIILKKLDKMDNIKANKLIYSAQRLYTNDVNQIKDIVKKNKLLYLVYINDYIWGKHWEIVYK